MNSVLDQALGLLGCFEDQPNFHARPQQAAMVKRMVRGLDEGGRLLLEAPTGTGKTLAYLCAALPLARARNRKLVIATGTLNLQRQLMEKDLPWFEEVTGSAVHYAVAKGRGRYACLTRLEALADEGAQAGLLEAQELFRDGRELGVTAARMLERIREQVWNGDLDEWREPLSAATAQHVASTRESCNHKSCPHFSACAFQAMRREVMRADVIVANHALLLSDLELGGGRVLPPPEECLLVIDEAHGLPRRALSQAARRVEPLRLQRLLDLATTLDGHLAGRVPESGAEEAPAGVHLETLAVSLEELHQTLRRSRFVRRLMTDPEGNSVDRRLLPGEKITAFVLERAEAMGGSLEALCKRFARYAEWLTEAAEGGSLKAWQQRAWSVQVPAVLRELEQARDCCRLLLAEDPADEPAIARWLCAEADEKEGVRLTLHVSPAWAAEGLREKLWERAWGVALVSATLRALGSFDHFRALSGLDEGVPAESFEPVFDYARQAELVIPWMERVPGTGDDADYFDEVARILPALLLEEKGSLVLFNARAAMERVYAALSPEFRGKVLMQGNGLSRAALLEAHRRRVESGRASILFGLAAFAEGVDLPGDLCRYLVLTRLPFQPFTHPVTRNIRDWLGKRHFREFSLPQASIRLVQACGRLLRSESDSGRIIILDRRLVLKRYGRVLLRHLPAYAVRTENSVMELSGRGEREATGGALIF